MRIALIQQHATSDKADNLRRVHARARPRRRGSRRAAKLRDELLIADIDLGENARSIARRQFLRERRPDVYGSLTVPSE